LLFTANRIYFQFIELFIKTRRDTRPRVSETKSVLDVPILFSFLHKQSET